MSARLAVERHATAEGFLTAAREWLREAEAENNLLLGIALHFHGRELTEPAAYWAIVRDATTIVGCACRTPPFRAVLSRMPARAAALLAHDAASAYGCLNGVNGPAATAAEFARSWTAVRGGRWAIQLRLRLHELRQVPPIAEPPPGELHRATAKDLALVRRWIDAYVEDTGMQAPADDVAHRLIDRGQLFIWIDDHQPRAMTAATRNTGTGCAINTVYTPPHHRRRGYATAAVTALSESLLRGGLRFCCLYTDVNNPTSNSIYAKIGYRPIREDVEISFDA